MKARTQRILVAHLGNEDPAVELRVGLDVLSQLRTARRDRQHVVMVVTSQRAVHLERSDGCDVAPS